MKNFCLFLLALLFAITVDLVVLKEARAEEIPPSSESRTDTAILRHVQALQVELRTFESDVEQRCPAPALRPSPSLTLTGELRGGVGADGLTFWGDHHPVSPFVEGRLALKHLPLDITATVLARHFTDDASYWVGKRKIVVGLSMPLSQNLSVFSEFERKYDAHPDDHWLITGVSWKFTALGGR